MWCKIIALEDQDVLVYKSFENNQDSVKVVFNIEGKGTVGITMGFDNEKMAQNAFYRVEKEDCVRIFKQIQQQLGMIDEPKTEE